MFKGSVKPYKSGEQGTFCDVLIQDDRGNSKKFKCGGLPMVLNFPAEGTYTVKWDPDTPKHPDGVYRILGVPGSPNDEIHSGNYCGDISKGWISQVTGCLIFGLTVGFIDGNPQEAILSSKEAIKELIDFTQKADIELTVEGLPSTAV